MQIKTVLFAFVLTKLYLCNRERKIYQIPVAVEHCLRHSCGGGKTAYGVPAEMGGEDRGDGRGGEARRTGELLHGRAAERCDLPAHAGEVVEEGLSAGPE